jgi:hypothetical protein
MSGEAEQAGEKMNLAHVEQAVMSLKRMISELQAMRMELEAILPQREKRSRRWHLEDPRVKGGVR